MKKAGFNQNQIAQELGRHPSTISRELKRNEGKRGYRPKQAHAKSKERKTQAKKHIKLTDTVCKYIRTLIKKDLSPQQVVGYLKRNKGIVLHHETIYQFIYRDQAEGGDLHTHLRLANKPYKKRYGKHDKRGQIKNKTSIEQRPEEINKKQLIGDWEGDLIIGKNHKGALLTLVERKTLYTVILPLQSKSSSEVSKAIVKALGPLKDRVYSITNDNGKEFAEHERTAKALGAKIYFAHPYASWERGINENTNGLIRQYFPKSMKLNGVTEQQTQAVMDRLNNRPRQTRGFKTPNELFLGLKVDLLAA